MQPPVIPTKPPHQRDSTLKTQAANGFRPGLATKLCEHFQLPVVVALRSVGIGGR